MAKFFEKYTGFLRSLKINYLIYNLSQYSKLKANKSLYKKYGLKKSVFRSISNADFKNLPDELPWLDKKNVSNEDIRLNPAFKSFSSDWQDQMLKWRENGYIILKQFITEDKVNNINQEIKTLLNKGTLSFNYTNKKIMQAMQVSNQLKAIAHDPQLNNYLSFILGRKVIPYHSINFIQGSEQHAHSDSIHMTTFPTGNLIAVWLALEDIDENNGPLFYYPGSHQLPYIMNEDYDHGGNFFQLGKFAYERYEERIGRMIEKKKLKKSYFHAKAGDILIWHANLIHGGDPIKDVQRSRNSMVVHYFGEEVICYHEITQRPAILDVN